MIDEAHHNFHTASGRYKPFASLISNDGYQVSPNRDKITTEALRNCEVLVIANAMAAGSIGNPGAEKPAFTEDECKAVHDWVKAGGAILLITDHEPFGSSAETLGKKFEVEMSKSAARDPANSAIGARGLLFSPDKKLIGDHAITRGRTESERINRVMTFTGQALKGPDGSTPLLKFASTASLSRIGNKISFAGGQSQGLALKYGGGRVVVLGEAAQLSAQLKGLERTPAKHDGNERAGQRQPATGFEHHALAFGTA